MKILLICDDYFDDSNANAVCSKYLVNELIKNNEVLVVTNNYKYTNQKKDYENCNFYFVNESLYNRLFRKKKNSYYKLFFVFYKIVRRLINIFKYPNVSFIRSKNLTKKIVDIIENEKIDTLISIYRPYDSIQCAINLKKKYKDLNVIAYHLDNIEIINTKNKLLREYLRRKISKSIENEKRIFNKIFTSFSSDVEGDNVYKIGFPVYMKKELIPLNYSFDDKFINVVYVGSLDYINRNPMKIFQFIEKINMILEKKIKIHIWGSIYKVDELLEKYKNIVKYNGIIENKYVEFLYMNCDLILNVGNQVTFSMLPSKLFHIFTTGKPILSFNYKYDSSLQYLLKYGNTINLYYEEDIDYNSIVERINNLKDLKVCDDIFHEFTPSFIVKEILK